MLILDIIMEGTVSQIFFIKVLVIFLCDLENYLKKFCKQFPDFWHKIKTKTSMKILRHGSLWMGMKNKDTKFELCACLGV